MDNISLFLDEGVVFVYKMKKILDGLAEEPTYREAPIKDILANELSYSNNNYEEIINSFETILKNYKDSIELYTTDDVITSVQARIKNCLYKTFRQTGNSHKLLRKIEKNIDKQMNRYQIEKRGFVNIDFKGYVPVKILSIYYQPYENRRKIYIIDYSANNNIEIYEDPMYEYASIPEIYVDKDDKKLLDVCFYRKLDLFVTMDNRIVKNNPKLYGFVPVIKVTNINDVLEEISSHGYDHFKFRYLQRQKRKELTKEMRLIE